MMKLKTVSLSSRPQRSESILKQEADGTTVLLSLDQGQYYSLDEVGGRLWELCDGTHTVAEMAALLGAEYDAALPTLERDALELLTDLAHENLVATSS